MSLNERFKELELKVNMGDFNHRLNEENLLSYFSILDNLLLPYLKDFRVVSILSRIPFFGLFFSFNLKRKIIFSLKDVLKNKVSMFIFLFVVFSAYNRNEFFAFSAANDCLEDQNYDRMIEILIHLYQQKMILTRS